MNGCELLSKIKETSPEALRIALSGYSSDELILESLHVAHQFIAKPADSAKLTRSIERAMCLHGCINENHIRETLGSVKSLPVLPSIYDELMAEIASGQGSIDRIGKIINSDLSLSSSILKIVNSAFFNLVRHVESAQEATTILGIETIKNIALSTSILTIFSSDKSTIAKMTEINKRSQQLGLLIAKMIKSTSTLSSREKDHAQIAGMMAYLGELFVLCYGKSLPPSNTAQIRAPFLGSYLLAFWGMPFPVIEATKWYQQPSESGIKEIAPLTIIHAAWSMMESCSNNGKVDWDYKLIQKEYLESIVDQSTLNKWAKITENFFNNEK